MSATVPPHSSAEHRAAIHRYLHELNSQWGNIVGVSCFTAVLREARHLAGRDRDDGILLANVPDEDRAEWAAVLMYLILLEQLGEVLRRKGTRTPKDSENTLMRALRLWAPTVKKSHADALRALRNALAHDFGLTSRDRSKKRHHRKFALSSTGALVVLPARRWNGEYGKTDDKKVGLKKNRGGGVRVNVRAVGDLVESVDRAGACQRTRPSPEPPSGRGERSLRVQHRLAIASLAGRGDRGSPRASRSAVLASAGSVR